MKLQSFFFIIAFLPSVLFAQGLTPVGKNYYSDDAYTKRIKRLSQILIEYTKVMDEFRSEIKEKIGNTNPFRLKDTDIIEVKFSGKELKKIAGTAWDIQNIQYPNLMNGLIGYPDFKNHEILRLELELLKLKNSPETVINKKQLEFEKSSKIIDSYAKQYSVD